MQIFKQQNTAKMHFFDYSLWNHYVNVLSHYYRWHDFFACLSFMAETQPSLLSFLSYFCSALQLSSFSLLRISPLWQQSLRGAVYLVCVLPSIAPCEVVCAKFAQTTFLSNSPSAKMLLICLLIAVLSLSNNSAIWS